MPPQRPGLWARRRRWRRKWPRAGSPSIAWHPGFIATPMTDALNDDQKAAINARIPTGRMGTPEEIAGAVLYLASHEAGYVTGAVLHVNGGMAMV